MDIRVNLDIRKCLLDIAPGIIVGFLIVERLLFHHSSLSE
jgi:hypothetical protein